MKKLLLIAFALLLFAPASAQDYAIDEGSVRLGGTVSFLSQGGDLYEGSDGERANTILLNPGYQYFIVPGLAVGADVLVNRQSQGDFSQTSLSIGPSASYFFGTAESTAYPFISVAPLFSSLRFDFGDGDSSASGFGAQFSGGVSFMLARNVALTGEAFYLLENLSPENVDDSVSGNTFGLQVGVSAFIF